MVGSFITSYPFFSVLCALILGVIFGAWGWTAFGNDAQSAKSYLSRERELRRAQRLQIASQALAQRLLYVCVEHKINPFPARDSRITGLVRGDGYVYVAPASCPVPSTDDWESHMMDAREVAVFKFSPGRLSIVSVDDREMDVRSLEFTLEPPASAAVSAPIRFG